MVATAARERTVDAARTLAAICSDPTAPAMARVAAASAILDRAWGKPRRRYIASAGRRADYVILPPEEDENFGA